MENEPERAAVAKPSEEPSASSGELSIWSYLTVLLRWRRLLLGTAIVFGALGAVSALLPARQYMASASFVPQEPSSTQPMLGQLATQLGLPGARPPGASPQFYANLLHSREVLRNLVVTSYQLSANGFTGDLVQYLGLSDVPTEEGIRTAVRQARRLLAVRVEPNTGVVSLEVRTTIPALSAAVANRCLELLNEYNLVRRRSQARAEREFAEQRLAQARQALTGAEDALAGFYARNRQISGSPSLQASAARLERAVAVQQQVYLSLAQSHEAAKIEEVRNTPVITILEGPGGFVEPAHRHLIRKTVLAVLLGLVAAVGAAFVAEYVKHARAEAPSGYRQFVSLRHEMLAGLRNRRGRKGNQR